MGAAKDSLCAKKAEFREGRFSDTGPDVNDVQEIHGVALGPARPSALRKQSTDVTQRRNCASFAE
jgi:hypothetical protein